METTTERQPRCFATISSPDGRDRIWIYRPTDSGFIDIACSFGLNGQFGFVDAIDHLEYVRVEEARIHDENYSTMMLSCQQVPMDCLERRMEDLPKVMEEWL